MIPKAELHVHLEGTAPPAMIRRLAERHGVPVPDGVFADEHTFAWTDFLDFLRTYDLAASLVRTAEDYRDITYDYLSTCAREGTVYVELIASPDHADAARRALASSRACTIASGRSPGPTRSPGAATSVSPTAWSISSVSRARPPPRPMIARPTARTSTASSTPASCGNASTTTGALGR